MKISKHSKYNGKFKVGDRFGCYEILDTTVYVGTHGRVYLRANCVLCKKTGYKLIKQLERNPSHCFKGCSIYLDTTIHPVGTKFGKWTRISENVILGRPSKYDVKCECENRKFISISALLNSANNNECKSCSSFQEKNHEWKGIGPIPGRLISRIKYHVKRKSKILEYTLSDLDLLNQWNKQNGTCALSGMKLTFDTNNITASLDRINSSKGYIRDNIQWIHKDINKMKQDYDEQYFVDLCKLIGNYKKEMKI